MSKYYIIGTKYEIQKNDGQVTVEDIFPYCVERKVMAIGFAWDRDLSKYYLKDQYSLERILKYYEKESPTTTAQMKKFMQIEEGDIIACKSVGSPIGKTARLDIIGYAIVVSRNGKVYNHDGEEFPLGLGHTVNVEFLEHGTLHHFNEGYGQSIHFIEDQKKIDTIFKGYSNIVQAKKIPSKELQKKNIDEKLVDFFGSYLKTAVHNKIQQQVYEDLMKECGIENISMEENYVDLVLKRNGKIYMIEVKPCETARKCIVEGIGQLLNYYYATKYEKVNIELMIVGKNRANEDDETFIRLMQQNLAIPFSYRCYLDVNIF